MPNYPSETPNTPRPLKGAVPSPVRPTGGPRPPGPPPERPELASVRSLTDLLDKAFKVARIYRITNTTAQTFTEKVYQELATHLSRYGRLTFIVQGYRLYYEGEMVYENTSPIENLAFTLFVDGIRSISFNQRLTKEDFTYFLETLGNDFDADASDEDIVTRLWQRNLSTISLITAEEIVKSLDSASVMVPQDQTTLNAPITQLPEIRATEVARQEKEPAAPASRSKAGFAYGFGLFTVLPEEVRALTQELTEESKRDDVTYLIGMLSSVLASEQADRTLSKMFNLLSHILERLLRDANWLVLTKLLGLLHQVEGRRDLSEPLKQRVKSLIETPVQSSNLDLIAETFNKSSEIKTEGFLAFLLQLHASAVPQLCELMTILKHQQHRSLVGESLVMLAKNAPEPLAKYLKDLKAVYVRDFVVVITRLRLSRFAEHLQALSQHEKSGVRKEAVRAFGILSPNGSGEPLLPFLQDADGSIRFSTLSLLTSGQYTVPVAAWLRLMGEQVFHNRMTVEKRLVFLAMSQTSQAEAIPYFGGLLKQWLWFKRRHRQELALLAAETLGRVGSPQAVAALEAGAKRRHRLIRNACKAALSNIARAKTGHP